MKNAAERILTQMELFTGARPAMPPFQPIQTSIDAARKIRLKAESQKRRIVEQLRKAGPNGLTRADLVTHDMPVNVVTARVNQLIHQDGLAFEPGVTRISKSGFAGNVVVAVEHRDYWVLVRGR